MSERVHELEQTLQHEQQQREAADAARTRRMQMLQQGIAELKARALAAEQNYAQEVDGHDSFLKLFGVKKATKN
jgi:hypothetical protein